MAEFVGLLHATDFNEHKLKSTSPRYLSPTPYTQIGDKSLFFAGRKKKESL